MDISLVISLLNEEESLPELLDWIERVLAPMGLAYEVVLIDDGSSDASWSVVERYCARRPEVFKGIKFQRNYGKSAALFKGFEAVRGRVVITMDADLQDSPEEIPELYRLIDQEKFDLVSGWKQKRFDPLSKTLPSKLYNWTVRKVSGIALHDFNCGLKAYRREVVKSIEVYGEMHRYIPVLAKQAGFHKITEKVVQHQARKYGTSKFGIERFLNGFLDLMSLTVISKYGKRPMHFFGTLGFLFFVLGFFVLAYLSVGKIFFQQYQMADRPLFYLGLLAFLFGSQLFLTGFLGELISRNSTDRNNYRVDKYLGINER